MAFRSKLARYNTACCEQVMPVPVIPVCAVSCCLPKPICEFVQPPYFNPLPQPPIGCTPSEKALESAPLEVYLQPDPRKIPNYDSCLPTPCPGTILTNTTSTTPSGYLLCDGSEVSRTTYSSLFLAIGTYYGSGDGVTTFNLPNLSATDTSCLVTYIIKT